jgi:hypothetical protein
MEIIINSFWEGPYQKESMLSQHSSLYNTLTFYLLQDKRYFNYEKSKLERIPKINFECCKSQTNHKVVSPHLFNFKLWKHSMMTLFLVDGIIVLFLALYLQLYIDDLLDKHEDSFKYLQEYYEKLEAYEQATGAAKVAAYDVYIAAETTLIDSVDDLSLNLNVTRYFSLIFLSYTFRHIFQIIFGKLKNNTLIRYR